MNGWRRFERQGDALAYWEIRQDGIRCFLRWGSDRTSRKASTSVLDDEEQARRHAARKIADRLRKGFTETSPLRDEAEADAGTPVLDVVRASAGPHAAPPRFLPVDGFDQVHSRVHAPGHPRGFHEYYVLRDRGRGAVRFTVRAGSHETGAIRGFLEFLCSRRDLAFDGRSHHKVRLPGPVGPFSHALFCSPALGRADAAHPAIAGRVATAFPVHDCEIGDDDPEVLVDARIHGHGALSYSDWGRPPQPVVDLRFDVEPSFYRRTRTFKVFRPDDLEKLMDLLPGATPVSWLEIRSFRGEIRRFEPATSPAFADVWPFLLG
ncbi:WGR domain-containing protein [Streptomyces sp. NBC_00820]|uniref:WGR domain-containing protein n=1 Tax=Streptomyces sp. NBC_00820 TaxID=2975842 RepID=UPI002ED40A79|nr:WGR domain-containing protein [Streptomyces sp. NBC_00820]